MKLYAIVPIIAATISFTVGLSDLLSWLQRKSERHSLSFVAICICIGLYGLACANEYNTENVFELVFWLRCEAILLNLGGLLFSWYLADQTHMVKRRWLILFFVVGFLGIVAQIIGFGNLTWNTNDTFHINVSLPIIGNISFLEIDAGPITQIEYFFYGIFLLGFSFFITIKFYRSGQRQRAKVLLIVQSIIAIAYLNDFCVNQNWYSFIFLIEYSWLAMVVIVGYQRGQQMIEAGLVRKALVESENRYRAIFESLQDVYFQTDRFGRVRLLSPSVTTVFGYRPEQIIGHMAFRFIADPQMRRDLFKNLKSFSRISDYEITLVGPNNRSLDVSITAQRSYSHNFIIIEGMIRDIAERKQNSLELRIALKEKEVLLNEIHHRVKNNLQIISSLLKLQQNRHQDEQLRGVIQDCRNQIFTMALIHEELYQSQDFMNIDFGEYLKNLIQRLILSFGMSNSVEFVSKAEKINLEIGKAIPCGLIVNELCTNALKYAFPPTFNGNVRKISVTLLSPKPGTIHLEVADSGIGLPPNFDIDSTTTLGVRIISRLCRQLGGALEYHSNNGSSFVIEFPRLEL